MTTKPQQTDRDDVLPILRANAPGIYTCPVCDERLSGPPSQYRCPYQVVPVESLGREA